jgi:hypothetical protein
MKMKDDLPVGIPFQVTDLIQNMLNKQDSRNIRQNYRMRLDAIREACEISIKKFDTEMNSPFRRSK